MTKPKPRLTKRIVRGLITVASYAEGELQLAESEACNAADRKENREGHAAVDYLWALIHWHEAKQKRTKQKPVNNVPLTWNEVADFYDKKNTHGVAVARAKPMVQVYEWAARQPEITENPDGTLSWTKLRRQNQ